MDKITASHEVIAYLMVLMNNYSAKELIKYKVGIYRSAKADRLRKPYCVNKVIILTIQVDEIAEALASRRKR